MAAPGFYRFEHKFYSRKGNTFHGPSSNRHLSAKSNYNTNSNKVLYPEDSIRINLPEDRYELYAELMSYSARQTRANARLAEDFTISFDKRMSHAHQREALTNFLVLVTGQGRACAAGDIHRNDPDNPHAQCLVLDEDEHGNAVMHFSRSASYRRDHSEIKGNLTKWLRKAWEFECNAVLATHGYDFRVDCRTNLEKGLSQAQKPRGYEVDLRAEKLEAERYDNDNQQPAETVPAQLLEVPPDAPTHELEAADEEPIPTEDETDVEDALEGDEDMPLSRKLEVARRDIAELNTMRGKRADVARLRTEYAYWRAESVTAREKAELAKNAEVEASSRSLLADQTMKETHFMGFRRGINLKLGPLQIKTAGFEKALRAEAELAKATYAEALRGADFREADSYANRATVKVWELEQRVASLEQHITMHERINGEEQDFDAADEFFTKQIGKSLEGVSPNDVMDAYEDGFLGIDEAKAMLEHMGHPELVTWIEAQQEEPLH